MLRGVDAVSVVQMVAGLALLVLGGETLVRGASGLAFRIGMSSLVVGLTVVAFATSAPELAVTLDAVLSGEPDLAVGNVVGSNIANVLLVLGISAVLLPLAVKAQVVRIDLPVMVGLSVLLLFLALDGTIGALDGAVLLAALAGYVTLAVLLGRRAGSGTPPDDGASAEGADPPTRSDPAPSSAPGSTLRNVVLVAIGVVMLVVGANLLVDGAVRIATELGVSNLVIGLTVVAIGTSMPELATSVVAARRGERDLAVGNVVGSNIFNIGLVLGVPAVLGAAGVPVPEAAIALDIPLMIAASFALLPVAFTGLVVARWEGGLFLGLYLAYTTFVLLAATEHDALEGFTAAMVTFVLPLVAVTLVVLTLYEVRRRRSAGQPLL